MKKIEIVEVGPRDGFQSIKEYIPVEEKLKIIDGLVEAGVRHMEYTSFVSPKAIPQLKDAAEITERVLAKYPDLDLFPLIPNFYGANKAQELGVKKVDYVVSFSMSHNKANINRTHEESLAEFNKIRDAFPDLKVMPAIATTFACPFEGKYHDPDALISFIRPYIEGGAAAICLADTIGNADPGQVRSFVTAAKKAYPDTEFQIHIHDTRNMGMACTLAAIESGIDRVQSTAGGLGGCPFAPGASGNLATEDLVYMLSEMGYNTGIDFKKLLEVAKYETTIIDGNYSSHQIKIDN